MKLQELAIVLPCHSLEDFPVYHQGENAQGLLAAWSALWHPVLVDAAGAAPTWARADCPPESFAGRLFVVPQVSQQELPAGWAERAAGEGAIVLRRLNCRDEIVARALAALDGKAGPVDAELAADFMAMGFCYLQVELLTRQMRYSSHIDQVYFQNETVAGAAAAVRGEEDEARSHLGRCFDILAQARDQFYPVDSYLVDVTLVAPTTLGPALRDQLNSATPTNLLLSAELVEQMATKEPETLEALRRALERGTASLIGGHYRETCSALEPLETVLADLQQGLEVYRRHLGKVPQVYGRRRFGLSANLPQILRKLGFAAALHVTFDGGRFPLGDQAKVRWEGLDGSAIDTLACLPLDASSADCFLNLSHRLGEIMDHDHVATLCFTHWPGATSPWYGDLLRVAKVCPALGKLVALDDYFSNTDTPHLLARFEPDRYQSPYLAESVAAGQPDAVSTHVANHRNQANTAATATLTFMSEVIGAGQHDETQDAGNLVQQAGRFAATLSSKGDSAAAGYLIVNPCSFSRRQPLDVTDLTPPPDVGGPVLAAAESSGRTQAMVEVPSLGFAWVEPGSGAAPAKAAAKVPPLAEENRLRNEHMEVMINPTTGSLQALMLYNARGNQLSQQVAFRSPSARPPGVMGGGIAESDSYSVMAADAIDTSSSAAMGQVVTRGRLLDKQGTVLAGFEQCFQLWRGSRVLLVEITLDPKVQPSKNPWDSYYAARFAWPNTDAELVRSVGGVAVSTSARKFEAPLMVEIGAAEHRLALLTGGLPFHRRSGARMLDTLLMVRGESARTFRLGIGVNLPHPMQAACGMLVPDDELAVRAARPAGECAGWLFHASTRNVVATHWQPLCEEGRQVGFVTRLLETEGRSGRVALSTARPVESARQTDFCGATLCDLPVEAGKIMIDFARHEWVQLAARWKPGP